MIPNDETKTKEGGNGEPVNEEVVAGETAAATVPEAANDNDLIEGAHPVDGAAEVPGNAPADDAAVVDETLKEGADMGKAQWGAPAEDTFEDVPKEDLDAEAGDDPDDADAEAARLAEVDAAGGYTVTESGKDAGQDADIDTDDVAENENVHPVLAMLKGLADGTKSRVEGQAFIDENYPFLND